MAGQCRPLQLILLTLILAAVPALASAEKVAAVWQPHIIKFRYAGFTSHYTCSGIRQQLRILLLAVGARDDIKMDTTCPGDWNRPQPFNVVTLGFATPVLPEQAVHGGAPAETFPAVWRHVDLFRDYSRYLGDGDCELVEQFSTQVLPRLDVRDVHNRVYCTPRQAGLANLHLDFRVLKQVPNHIP